MIFLWLVFLMASTLRAAVMTSEMTIPSHDGLLMILAGDPDQDVSNLQLWSDERVSRL
jgi:hypothetical protein